MDQTKEVKQAEAQYNPNICRMQKCTKMIRYFFCKCSELLSMHDHPHKTNQVALFIIVAYYITTLHRR